MCCVSMGPPDEGKQQMPHSTDSLKLKNEQVNLTIATYKKQKCQQLVLFFLIRMGEVTGNFLAYQEIKTYLAFA